MESKLSLPPSSQFPSKTCDICALHYTSKNRKKMDCENCLKSYCAECAKKYVLLSTNAPHCLHCRKEYSDTILKEIFTQRGGWLKELKRKKLLLLVETERLLFSQTVQEIEYDKILSSKRKLENIHRTFLQSLNFTDYAVLDNEFVSELNDIRISIKNLDTILKNFDFRKHSVTSRQCFDCKKGFFSAELKCTYCSSQYCTKCEKKLEENIINQHECSADDILSVKIINNETKACPHCFARVHKISGCSQMWCTSCNNSFDWNTGNKILGPIHNPHFTEFQNKLKDSGISFLEQRVCRATPWQWIWPSAFRLIQEIKNVSGHPTDVVYLNSPEFTSSFHFFNRAMIFRSSKSAGFSPYSERLYKAIRRQRVSGEIDDKLWVSKLRRQFHKQQIRERHFYFDVNLITLCREVMSQYLMHSPQSLSFEYVFNTCINNLRVDYNESMRKFSIEFETTRKVHIDEKWVIT